MLKKKTSTSKQKYRTDVKKKTPTSKTKYRRVIKKRRPKAIKNNKINETVYK